MAQCRATFKLIVFGDIKG